MISSALFCDALIGNFQEKMMKKHNASNAEIVLYSYFIGFVYLFLVLLVTGELRDGTEFCIQVKHKKNIIFILFLNIFCYLVESNNLCIHILVFFIWIFWCPSCTCFNQNMWCFSCCDCDYMPESCNYSYIFFIVFKTIHIAVRTYLSITKYLTINYLLIFIFF